MGHIIREKDWVGEVFADRYQVHDRIGSGASATVYRAQALDSGERLALKISRPHVLTKQRRAARFLREVQAVQRIDHEGCVRIVDWGIEEDCAYIAMELVDGEDLFDVIRRESPMPEERAVGIAIAMCDVLQAAHDLGVVHRDLKPRNVIVCNDGDARVKILDFGLAKLIRLPADDDGTLPLDLTKPGAVLGTPHYMAPEQVRVERDVDGRADIYAVCVILYEMLTGRRPVEERNAVRALLAISTNAPTLPSTHVDDLDLDLERLIMRGLAKSPADRFPSADELSAALTALDLTDAADGERTRVREPDTEPTRVRQASEDDVLTKVTRTSPALRKLRAKDRDEEVPTRVYAGQQARAPRMKAKRSAPRTVPDPEDHAPTKVMGSRHADVAHARSKVKRLRRNQEIEKGLRAALITITVAALTAAVGRWLGVW